MVRYRVKPDQAPENEKLVRAVYEELHENQPEGIRYATFKLDDGVSFVHIASTDAAGPSPLSRLRAFREFQAGIEDRCQEQPVVAELHEIGSYRQG
jgi:hypothetical protein